MLLIGLCLVRLQIAHANGPSLLNDPLPDEIEKVLKKNETLKNEKCLKDAEYAQILAEYRDDGMPASFFLDRNAKLEDEQERKRASKVIMMIYENTHWTPSEAQKQVMKACLTRKY